MSASKTNHASRPEPWIEKHRPLHLEDIQSQSNVIRALQDITSTPQRAAQLPHLLFFGPPGTGKTTTALALARRLFLTPFQKQSAGVDASLTLSNSQRAGHHVEQLREVWRSRVKELNASDERGISIMRDKVKKFAQQSASGSIGAAQGLPPYKIIILDEADAVLPDAQAALRRMMEDYTHNTRFIIICNYVSRIIDAITSRCVKFGFQALPKPDVVQRLRHIHHVEMEGAEMQGNDGPIATCGKRLRASLDVPDSFYEQLFDASGGDLRSAITTLQSAVQFQVGDEAGLTTKTCEGEDTSAHTAWLDMLNIPPPQLMIDFLRMLAHGDHLAIAPFVQTRILGQGYAASRFVQRLSLLLVEANVFIEQQAVPRYFTEAGDKSLAQVHTLCELLTCNLCMKIAEMEHRLLDGASEYLQLLDLGATCLRAAKHLAGAV